MGVETAPPCGGAGGRHLKIIHGVHDSLFIITRAGPPPLQRGSRANRVGAVSSSFSKGGNANSKTLYTEPSLYKNFSSFFINGADIDALVIMDIDFQARWSKRPIFLSPSEFSN
jgi:hypothetical protein